MKEGTGRIVRFELIPLSEMGGRPRVDVLCNMSGIFRDAFQNVVELLDDLFKRAADAKEPPEQNYIKKHALAMQAQGITSGRVEHDSCLFKGFGGEYDPGFRVLSKPPNETSFRVFYGNRHGKSCVYWCLTAATGSNMKYKFKYRTLNAVLPNHDFYDAIVCKITMLLLVCSGFCRCYCSAI